MSKIVTAIQQRVSNPKLMAPAPTREELEVMFQCAIRAPDHGRLRPWRFIVCSGDALEALGEAFVKTEPDADTARQQRLRGMPLRAPMIIVVVAKVDKRHKKVPEWEQIVTVGIATQHLQLAAQELGYGTMWRTGAMTEASEVRAHLKLQENESIVAFLYTGTVDGQPRKPEFQPLDSIVEYRGI